MGLHKLIAKINYKIKFGFFPSRVLLPIGCQFVDHLEVSAWHSLYQLRNQVKTLACEVISFSDALRVSVVPRLHGIPIINLGYLGYSIISLYSKDDVIYQQGTVRDMTARGSLKTLGSQ